MCRWMEGKFFVVIFCMVVWDKVVINGFGCE